MSAVNPYETDNRTGINQEGQLANTPVERLTASSIVGDNILDRGGVRLGCIEDLMINLRTGMVEYAIVELGSLLGTGGRLFAIPFTALEVEPEKKAFVLDRDPAFMEKLQGFDKSAWPQPDDGYYDEVNAYWGLSTSTP